MRLQSRKMLRRLVSGLLMCLSWPTLAADMSLNPPLSNFSTDIYPLHRTLFWVCLAIGIVLSLLLVHSLFKYRRCANTRSNKYQDNSLVELFWLSIPCFLLIAIAVPATLVLMHFDIKGQTATTHPVSDYFLK